MVGINSKGDSAEEECKASSVEESVPQRSILDFFKSPGKPANKQQNLLGYFGKTCPSEAVGTVNGHGKTQVDDKKIGKKIGNRKSSTGAEKSEKKTSKRKRTDVSDSAVDIDNECGEDKRAKRKKNNKICKPLNSFTAKGKDDKGKECNGEDLDSSKENYDTEWKYERNPNDKLQKEFDTIADEFKLCDSEVKGKENKKIVNEASSEDEVVLLSDGDEVDSMSAVSCNGSHEGSANIEIKENTKTSRPCEETKGNDEGGETHCEEMKEHEDGGETFQPCEEIKGKEERGEEECKSSVDKKSGSTFEWKKTLDMEKIKTPKGKEDKEKKKKKRKMKLKKPEKSQLGSGKPLNLSDVCENLADVSILSDSSQTESTEWKGEEVKIKPLEGSAVVEVSFAEFLESAEAEDAKTENTKDDVKVLGDEVDGKVRKASKLKKKKCDQTNTKSTEDEKIDAPTTGKDTEENDNADVEVNYMDYLKSLSSEEEEESEITKTEKIQAKEKPANIDTCKDKVENQTEEEEIPMPKQYPSITNFFKKVDKTQSNGKASSAKVTVKADVHTEPQVSPPTAITSDGQKRSPLSGSKLDQEIQILGSEIVSVETPKTGLKKRMPKEKDDCPQSDTKEMCLESPSVKEEKKTKRLRKSLIKDLNDTENEGKKEKPKKGSQKKESKDKEEEGEADDCICISDAAEKDEKEDKMKRDFLQSGVSDVALGKKTSQATFSFGKAGFQMKKATPTVTRVRKSAAGKEGANDSFGELPVSESTPLKDGEGKKKRGRKKKTEQIDVSVCEQDSDLDTSGISRRRSLRNQKADTLTVNHEKEGQSKNKKQDLEEMTVAERRKLIRRKYSVALLDQTEKHGSPIRIRLTRYSKSSTSQDDTLSPSSQRKLAKKKAKLKKTSTAQKLLEKAKRGKTLKPLICELGKKNKDKAETEKEQVAPSPVKTGRRRSARLSDRHKSMEEVLIVDDESEDDCYTPTKPKAGKRGRPKAKTSSCTPKKEVKAPQKLAPIFMKRGKKEEPVTPVKKVLDPEAEKRRRAFLMSDVPDELRRQAASVTMVADADYPPIPKINHVQQIGISDVLGGKDLWKLPDVILNYRKDLNEGGWKMQGGTWGDNLITKTESTVDYTKIKTFTSHPKISESSIDLTLSEIGRLNPVYPVKKMYSILREKKEDDLEEEVTEKNNKKASKPDDEDTKLKTRPRRSLRLRPVIEVIDVIGSPEKVNDVEEAQAEKQDSVPPTLVFTERYQPLNTSEVVGNTALLKKLKAWLVEWKHRVDKEARKARMLLMKKSKGKRPKEEEDSGDWWADDASDFDMSSDDSEDEDSLCNTVMLTGPTGIGKTATVYALAQELGFKVFEVNASSCRNGKRILAQLQEATQSHQVSKNSVGGSNTPVKIDKKKESGVEQKKKLPTAFTNLFKQVESQSKKDVLCKKAPKKEDGDSRKKKRKREEEEEEMSKSSKKKKKDQEKSAKKSAETEKVSAEVDSGKSLSLSSTSLILFDEVDIVFEQDKAFWAAVQSFMSTTKIPIILTSNDSKLHTKFEGRFEHYAFKIPSMVTSTIYLQLVCLVENIRTDRQDIYNLLSLHNGDIRKAMNTLQLWALSGGGCTLNELAIKNIEPKKETQDTIVQNSAEESSQSNITSVIDSYFKKDDDEDDDFVTIKPITKRRKPLLFDEDSNSLPPPLPDTCLSCDVSQPVIKHDQTVDNAGDLPSVHLSCVNTMLGCGLGGDQDFLKRLTTMAQEKESGWLPTAVEACLQYHCLKTDIIYNQHLELLSLPKQNVDSSLLTKTRCMQKEVQKPKRRRIKLACDLYDSEGSGDEDCDKKDTVMKKESNIVDENVTPKESSKNMKEEVKSLSSLYKFYDTLAFTDVMRQVHEKSDLYGVSFGKEDFRGSISIGLEDQLVKYGSPLSSRELGASLCSELELRSLLDLHKRQEEILQSLDEVEEDAFSVPVTPCSISSVRNESARCVISSKSDLKRVNDNIHSNMPLLLHCQPSVVAMDYTPTLRSMCKNEQIREAAKAKRRFHHYLDNIGLPLKTTTISALCSSFT